MTLLNRKNIVAFADGFLFTCFYCEAQNYDLSNPDLVISYRCRSCERKMVVNHEFPVRKWTQREIDYLREHFPHEPTYVVAYDLSRSVSGTQQKAMKLGVRKTDAFMRSPESGIIRPGAKPWNKGKSYVPGGRCAEGWFTKGHKPHNTKTDGWISVRTDSGSGRPYPHIRIAEGHWKMLHVHVWEQTNGPVPDGMIIVFKDGNTFRPELDNLEIITRAENMRRNTIHRYPPELKEQIRLLKKLERKLSSYAP